MMSRTLWKGTPIPGVRVLGAVVMMLTMLAGTATPVAAQDGDMVSVSVAVWIDCLDTDTCNYVMYVPITATTLDGAFLDTCTVTVDPEGPLPGCSVRVPAGTTVVLTEDASALPAGYAPDENPIIFDTADIGHAQYDAGFGNSLQGAEDTTGQTSLFIWTRENGQVVYDACYILVDARDVACDENGNGYVFFSHVPIGTYTVRQVADLGPNRYVPDFTIEVTGIDDPGAPYPGMETFSTEIVSTPAASTASGTSGTSASPDSSASTSPAGSADLMSILPSIADVPGGLVETGRHTRALPDVVANYTNPAETSQRFKAWGWQGNAVASFALPSDQPAQSGQVNGVYVSIHRFGDADAAREALDFSIAEQAAGTDLREISTDPLGEYTRSLYGPEDYGNETTVLTQQGDLLIRVSAAMLDGDPTAEAVAVTEAILRKVTAQQTTTIDQDTSGTTGSAVTPDSGASSGTGGLTVKFWDARNNVPDTTTQCVQLVGATKELCAIDFPDGQIQINGIPAGTYEICVTRYDPDVPGGPVWAWFRSPASVTIAPGSHETITLNLYMDFEPGERTLCGFDDTTSASDGSASSTTPGSATTVHSGGSSGTGSLTVYFFSPRDNMRQTVGDCVELVGATKALCSEDYPGGQIEIVDIPAGTYEVCVTHGAPHFFWGRSHGPKSVTITPGSHETIQLDVYAKWNIDAGRQCGFD